MDVAKQLAQWKEQSPEQWLRAANRYLPPGVTFILVLAIAYQLATLTWALMPGAAPTAAAPASRSTEPGGTERAVTDYSVILSTHPWGEPPTEPVEPIVENVVDAPDTTLSLALTGILASGEGDPNGQAIISANRGQEKTYRIGQAIEGANGATLHSVFADRVLLNRGGNLETLRLPKETLAGGGSAAGRVRSPALAPAAQPPANESLRGIISQNASRLTDIVRLAPHVDGGQVVGFRVTPGRDKETFEALGFQAGDVVTDINGVVLDDASRGLQAFEALGEATMANVTVLREGVPQVLVIDTTKLQSLQERRE
jgi:general secretion pathway protein C